MNIPYVYKARCTNVVDGDTVDLYVDQGFHSYRVERFRLLGVDAPELRAKEQEVKDAAQKTKQWLIDTLKPNSTTNTYPLLIKTEKADAFGRYLVTIWLDDLNVNDELIRLGLAVVFKG